MQAIGIYHMFGDEFMKPMFSPMPAHSVPGMPGFHKLNMIYLTILFMAAPLLFFAHDYYYIHSYPGLSLPIRLAIDLVRTRNASLVGNSNQRLARSGFE